MSVQEGKFRGGEHLLGGASRVWGSLRTLRTCGTKGKRATHLTGGGGQLRHKGDPLCDLREIMTLRQETAQPTPCSPTHGGECAPSCSGQSY